MKKLLLLMLAMLITFMVACSNEEPVEEVKEEETNDEVVETVDEEVEEENVLTMTDEELIQIARDLNDRIDAVYTMQTEEEFDEMMNSSFMDVEFYYDPVKNSFEPGKYSDMSVSFENETVETKDVDFFVYRADFIKEGTLSENGNLEVLDEGRTVLNIIKTEEGTYKIFSVGEM